VSEGRVSSGEALMPRVWGGVCPPLDMRFIDNNSATPERGVYYYLFAVQKVGSVAYEYWGVQT
jgi:hypothetical protein